MTDVLLIQPPIRDFYLTAKRTIPYGLACIAACLRDEGFSVQILDALATGKSKKVEMPGEMLYLREFYSGADVSPFCLFNEMRHFGLNFDRIGEKARESGAFLIGISSLFTAYSGEAIRTAEAVKAACPGAIVVLGGHHPTDMPEEVLQNECVDFIIRGEGELAFSMLARALRDGASVESVPGVGFRTSGKFQLSSPALLENLDDLPLPAIELIDNRFYGRRGKGSAVISASRGCPRTCSYCSIGCSDWSRFRLKSVRTVMKELDRAVSVGGARFIDFEDENISCDRNWFLELLVEIRRGFGGLGLELRAMNGLFPPTLDEELVQAMKDAGFTALNLSLCTTCTTSLKKFRRPDVRESFEKVLVLAEKYGLEAVGYVIAGAPGQMPQDSVEDLLYLASKKVIAGVSIFYPSPGSDDFNQCRADGLLPSNLALLRSTALPISNTSTRKDSVTILRLSRILNFVKSLTSDEKKEVMKRIVCHAVQPGLDLDSRCRAESALAMEELQSILRAERKKGEGESPRDGEVAGRRRIGRLLLSSFLRDGTIRGITPEGEIFEHATSDALCAKFKAGMLRQM